MRYWVRVGRDMALGRVIFRMQSFFLGLVVLEVVGGVLLFAILRGGR